MLQMTKRQKKLVACLHNHPSEFRRADDLAKDLQLSQRTIRNQRSVRRTVHTLLEG